MTLRPEEIVHINFKNWFEYHYPILAEDFHHFANERTCSPMEGAKLKRMGVKKGVADFFLAVPSLTYHGLWIELKVGKNKLSPEQQRFLERKNARGYKAIECRGLDECKKAVIEYLSDMYLDTETKQTNCS